MKDKADEFCFVAVRRENRTEHVRDVHSRQAGALAAGED